jgi:hypothetical protein
MFGLVVIGVAVPVDAVGPLRHSGADDRVQLGAYRHHVSIVAAPC